MIDADPGPRVWPWLTLIALVAAVGFALHSPWLSLHEIEIVGAVESDPAAAVAAAGVGEGAILVWIDTGAVAAEVQRDPWVADVRVTRVWPDRLVVEVMERTPLLWVEGTGDWMLVASDGFVLEAAPEPGPGLLRVAVPFASQAPGVRPDDPVWHELVGFAGVMGEDLGRALTIVPRGSEMWTDVLGFPVRLGGAVDLADKARTLRALLEAGVPSGATIDVSSPVRPTLIPGESGTTGG